MTDTRWLDPELDRIFEGDPELAALAHRVRAARPEPVLDPRFEAVLRAQLMREAPAALRTPSTPRAAVSRRPRSSWWRRPNHFAWAGATLGVALVAAAVLSVTRPIQDHQVTAMSPVAMLHAVSPDNVITVAFSQPMNETAVVAGLHIRPATEVSTTWQGNNLLITPKHHLTGNTPYTVTIDRSAAVARSGQVAASDIRITFGTAPTPPTVPSVAQLAPTSLGPVDGSATLIAAPGGGVIATASSGPAAVTPVAVSTPTPAATPTPHGRGPSPSPSPSASPSASASASPSATPTPGASPSATPASPSGEMVSLAPGGGPATDLGPAVARAALSPNGLELMAAVPSSAGTDIVLVPVRGGARTVLASLSSRVLATGWQSADTALVAEPDRVVSVDLQGHVGTVAALPSGTTSVIVAPGGATVFAGSSAADGQLIDLATAAARPLGGSRELAAFSGDGKTVAWIDATGGATRLVTSPVGRAAADSVPLQNPADTITGLALDATGARVAFVEQPQGGAGSLQLVALPSGTVIATGPWASAPVFSAHGDQLAFISGGNAELASVPGGGSQVINPLPDGAAAALAAFVDAQVGGDPTTLSALVTPGLDAVAATPRGLTRAYVISEIANADGTLGATARLIIDASASQPLASFADETLTLAPDPAHTGYLVSAIQVGAVHAEPIGPHVVQVTPSASGKKLVLRIAFDSDLRASTVAGALTVTRRGGGPALTGTTVYDEDSRTATITLDVPADTPVTVNVDTSLVDVDGQPLATAFSADEGGSTTAQ